MFHDLRATIQLSFLPTFFGLAIVVGALGLANTVTGLGPDSRLMYNLYILIFMFAFSWQAVCWHRFVLLNETSDGLLPKISGKILRSYLWAVIRIAIVVTILIFLDVLLTVLVGSLGNEFPYLEFYSVFAIFYATLLFRLILILPSAAVGEPMSLWRSWKTTKGYVGPLIVLAIALNLLSWLITLSLKIPMSGSTYLTIKNLFVWFSILMSISVITTLYGVCVEKREL